jgi:phosphopantothenoylcysteine decarboxylase/phosphopantothenate--cysteine ligase
MASGKRIILGVTGGIAAYKAVFLLRELQKDGGEVRVTMTANAARFVGAETFLALSRHEVIINTHPENEELNSRVPHIEWGNWADLFVIAPCTANTLAKIACGLADNMLTSTILAARCPLFICPTMDGKMYQAPAVQDNLSRIRSFGYHLLEPEEGYLASGLEAKGRLPEIDVITQKIQEILANKPQKGLLSGKKVFVTAGPTREYLDPVRFISNPSSGKMGFAMAEAARDLGGDVTLIHGPVHLSPPAGIRSTEIESTDELFEQSKKHADADVIIMAAAVSDFTPEEHHPQKMKKESAATTIKFRKTPDILAWLGQHKKKGQTLVGFAMETENLLENGRQKLAKKNLDWIAANSLTEENAGFGSDKNTVYLIGKKSEYSIKGTKKAVADEMLKHIFDHSFS